MLTELALEASPTNYKSFIINLQTIAVTLTMKNSNKGELPPEYYSRAEYIVWTWMVLS